jgi:hypothetical protein
MVERIRDDLFYDLCGKCPPSQLVVPAGAGQVAQAEWWASAREAEGQEAVWGEAAWLGQASMTSWSLKVQTHYVPHITRAFYGRLNRKSYSASGICIIRGRRQPVRYPNERIDYIETAK